MIDFSLEDRAQRRQAQQVLQEVTAAPRQIELSSNCLIRLPHRLSLMRSRGMVRRAFPFLKLEKNRNSRSADGRERRARRRLARMAVAKTAGLFLLKIARIKKNAAWLEVGRTPGLAQHGSRNKLTRQMHRWRSGRDATAGGEPAAMKRLAEDRAKGEERAAGHTPQH
jgi:hypothetical protein